MKFTIGADPEFALINNNEEFVSAISILPDKKRAKKEKGNKFYYDNVLAEIGLKPSGSKVEFIENIKNSLQSLKSMIGKNSIKIQASMEYSDEELKHKKSYDAGCFSEISAYTGKQIVFPKEFISKDKKTRHMMHVTNIRTAGGHIHLGSEQLVKDDNALYYTVKMLDLFLGVTDLFINKDETSKRRRKIYGQVGSFRTPEYGVEYRTLSNYWLSSPVYASLVYEICNFVLNFVEEESYWNFWDVTSDEKHICFGYDNSLLMNNINKFNRKSSEKFLIFILNYMPNYLAELVQHAIDYKPSSLELEWSLK